MQLIEIRTFWGEERKEKQLVMENSLFLTEVTWSTVAAWQDREREFPSNLFKSHFPNDVMLFLPMEKIAIKLAIV